MAADYGDKYARLIRNIQGVAQPQKTFGIATVSQVTKNAQGMAVSAVATIGNEANVSVALAQGIGTITHEGETWLAELEGGAFGKWRLRECIATRFFRVADQTDYTLPTPQIPDTEHGGLYTESNQAGVGTPNASPDPQTADAALYLYYWTTLPGSYNVFDQAIKGLAYQIREEGFEEWELTNQVPIYPDRKTQGVTTTTLTTSGTAVGIAADLGYAGFLFQGQPAYWRINSEVMLGIYSGGTIGIVDYEGPGSAIRGEGFVYSTGGRAQAQGGALAEHAIGSTVELLVGQVALPRLRPGTNYEIHLAFVNHANRLGPWSQVQSFTSWSQDIQPAAPENLTVVQYSHVLNASWSRVTEDVEGNVRADIRRYAVLRHTAALAGTLTFAAATAVASAVIAGTSSPISNTSAQVPSTQGYGNFIGVAAISDQGLLGEWDWAEDEYAPPYPNPANVEIRSAREGVFVSVDLGTNGIDSQTGGTVAFPPHNDPGFTEYWLWKAESNAGSAATVVARSQSSSVMFYAQSMTTGYYKVTAADGAGNSNGPATYPTGTPRAGQANSNTHGWTSNWKFVLSLYIEDSWPRNGNFRAPNPTETDAMFWRRTPNPAGYAAVGMTSFDYEENVGVDSNRAYELVGNASGFPFFGGVLSDPQLIPTQKTAVVTMWIKTSRNANLTGFANYYLYDSEAPTPVFDATTNRPTNYDDNGFIFTPGPVAITANTWTKITFDFGGGLIGSYPDARSMMLELRFQAGGADPGTTITIDYDSVAVTWS